MEGSVKLIVLLVHNTSSWQIDREKCRARRLKGQETLGREDQRTGRPDRINCLYICVHYVFVPTSLLVFSFIFL